MIEPNNIYHGDCMELLPLIPDASVDMILCDLPYAITTSKWDSLLDLLQLWEQYKRIIKDDGAIVLFASGAFTHKLVASNEHLYRYKWIWVKNKTGNFINCQTMPLTSFEEVLVFSKAHPVHNSKNRMRYYPQDLVQAKRKLKIGKNKFGAIHGSRPSVQEGKEYTVEYANYPRDILYFDKDSTNLHPTQKPTSLCEYLIKTYTNPNDLVLDNCLGSGTTAIACINTGRQYIGIEKEEQYFNVSLERIKQAQNTYAQHTIEEMSA